MSTNIIDPKMQINPYVIYSLAMEVDGKQIRSYHESHISMDERGEVFAEALAECEGLALINEHWEVTEYTRHYYQEHGIQSPVRDLFTHFTVAWDKEFASNHYLHETFPNDGPQKQGNQLAGIRRNQRRH